MLAWPEGLLEHVKETYDKQKVLCTWIDVGS